MEKYDLFRVGNPYYRYKSKLHDKALKRALISHCKNNLDKPSPQIETIPYRTLFVFNLDYSTSEETLRKRFEKYGDINNLNIVKDIVTGESKGYGFIEYSSSYNAELAYKVKNK